MKNKNGFTLIELIVCFALVTVLTISLFKTVLSIQQKQAKNVSYNSFLSFVSVLNNTIQNDFTKEIITSVVSCGTNCYDITYKDKELTRLQVDRVNNTITYGSNTEKLPVNYRFYKNISFTNHSSVTTGNYNSYYLLRLPIKSDLFPNMEDIKYMYQYNSDTINDNKYILNLDLDGGNLPGDYNNLLYSTGTVVNLPNPTKENYDFFGWIAATENVLLSGNIFTMGNSNVNLIASWRPDIATKIVMQKFQIHNDEGLMYDDFNNLRFSGANPNNYILFNGEKWRIIGIFDVSNGSIIEKRIKIVKTESLGNYSWDSSASTVNSGAGINEWSQSDINLILNDYYINAKANQICYIGINEASSACSFDTDGKHLTTEAQSLIENVVWNLGGNVYSNPNSAPFGLPTNGQYTAERETSVMQNPSDGITRTTTWTGLVGLIYVSDYGYASTNSDCRTNLRAGITPTYNYTNTQCKNDNWLHAGIHYWTISPYSNNASYVFRVRAEGFIDQQNASSRIAIMPSVYLKKNTLITGGLGTFDFPYTISIY